MGGALIRGGALNRQNTVSNYLYPNPYNDYSNKGTRYCCELVSARVF